MRRFWLILLLAGLFIPACHAAEVTLTWDLVEPTSDGYRLFARTDGYSYNYDVALWDGAVPPATVTVDDGTEWYFVVRAYCTACGDPSEPRESADSNEVSFDGTIVVPPIGLTVGATGLIISWEEISEPPTTNQIWDAVTLPDGSILFMRRR